MSEELRTPEASDQSFEMPSKEEAIKQLKEEQGELRFAAESAYQKARNPDLTREEYNLARVEHDKAESRLAEFNRQWRDLGGEELEQKRAALAEMEQEADKLNFDNSEAFERLEAKSRVEAARDALHEAEDAFYIKLQEGMLASEQEYEGHTSKIPAAFEEALTGDIEDNSKLVDEDQEWSKGLNDFLQRSPDGLNRKPGDWRERVAYYGPSEVGPEDPYSSTRDNVGLDILRRKLSLPDYSLPSEFTDSFEATSVPETPATPESIGSPKKPEKRKKWAEMGKTLKEMADNPGGFLHARFVTLSTGFKEKFSGKENKRNRRRLILGGIAVGGATAVGIWLATRQGVSFETGTDS